MKLGHNVIRIHAAALCLLLFFPFFVAKTYAREVIKLFSSNITVLEDGTIVVTELIRAKCEGRKIRHGIYRDIPKFYSIKSFFRKDSRLRILSVKIDGVKSPYHTKLIYPDLRIYIGSKYSLIPEGIHDFSITYSMKGMIGYFDNFDELYWNVTGTDWSFPIEKAVVKITLPKPEQFLRYATYTGYKGSRFTMARLVSQTDGEIEFETTRPLGPGQGFTVAVAWPKGVVKEPGSLEQLWNFFWDNITFFMALILGIVAFGYYLYAWTQVGKDPELGPIMPVFNPPSEVDPASARYIRKMGWDEKILAVVLVNLAVKGVIKFIKKGKTLVLEKTGLAPKKLLSDIENSIFTMLFRTSKVLELKTANAKKITSAINRLQDLLAKKNEKIYFLTNSKYLIPGLLLSVIAFLMLGLGGTDKIATVFLTAWLSVWSVASTWLLVNGIKALKARVFRNFFLSIPFNVMLIIVLAIYSRFVGIHGTILFIAIMAMNIIFYYLMKAPTMRGTKLLRELEGFRMFLKTAEAKRLEALTPADKLPELFEEYLPWAMALDVENKWGEKFEAILREKGQEPHHYSPSWYVGGHYHSLSNLSSSISSSLGNSIASATAVSGSGGGGSVGGGGGGGGGGGW